MEFWNSLLTEKSWNVLQQLKLGKFQFVLIGGWASYLWTKQHKSKDIDIIIPKIEDLSYLKQAYQLKKNDHLKKYEVIIDGIDIDVYVPYYSELALPIDTIMKYVTKIEGFEVVRPEILLILKQGAEIARKESVKGQKDRIDIISLLVRSKINFSLYRSLIEENNLQSYKSRLRSITLGFKELRFLDLNLKEYSRIKKNLLKEI